MPLFQVLHRKKLHSVNIHKEPGCTKAHRANGFLTSSFIILLLKSVKIQAVGNDSLLSKILNEEQKLHLDKVSLK